MAADAALLALLARALRYPDARTPAFLAECRAAADATDAEIAGLLRQFAASFDDLSIEQMQERFTGTFDFDPKCSLDIGWHLFGENYDRGDFLARMREALAASGVEEGTDLPDHLPTVLQLVGRMDSAAATELARTSIMPALEKILAALDGQQSPYAHLVRAVHRVLSDHVCAVTGGAHA